MLVSVVVCTHRAENVLNLAECIRSLQCQTVKDMEIIVVVDGNWHLYKILKDKYDGEVKLVQSPSKQGAFGAGNIGARGASSHVVAFIDDDAVAESKWLEELLDTYDEDNAVGVGGLVHPLWAKEPRHFPRELYWLIGATPEGNTSNRNTYGVNMSFRKSVLDNVGYLNGNLGFKTDKLMQGAEAELAIRIRKCYGKGMSYNPRAIVYHKVPEYKLRVWYLMRRAYWQGFSKRIITRLHSQSELDTEKGYLGKMVFGIIPGHCRKMEWREGLLDLAVIVSVGTGYMIGSLRK